MVQVLLYLYEPASDPIKLTNNKAKKKYHVCHIIKTFCLVALVKMPFLMDFNLPLSSSLNDAHGRNTHTFYHSRLISSFSTSLVSKCCFNANKFKSTV